MNTYRELPKRAPDFYLLAYNNRGGNADFMAWMAEGFDPPPFQNTSINTDSLTLRPFKLSMLNIFRKNATFQAKKYHFFVVIVRKEWYNIFMTSKGLSILSCSREGSERT